MSKKQNGIGRLMRLGATLLLTAAGVLGAASQNSLPAPGSGGGRPGGGGFGGGMGGNSLPAPGAGGQLAPPPGGPYGPGPWGSPWGGPMMNPNGPGWQNTGRVTVMACGYDSYGVWRTIPLRVAYAYNGIQYNVTVINAWNPWTDMWNRGVDQPAFNTSYYLRGNTYNFYTVLSTGTYYFNL